MKISHLVVHYSATYADQNLTVADIDKMHKARGWKGVGYHWVITRSGIVQQGRPESQVGAHVGGQNTGKIGICCIGGTERATGPDIGVDNRTPAQIDALINLIRDCLKRYPGAKIVGHRDLAPTQCPGFDVAQWWAKVQKQKQPDPKPVHPDAPVKTPDIGEELFHVVKKGESWWSIAKLHGVSLVSLLSLNDAMEKDVLLPGRRVTVRRPPPVPAPKPQPTMQPSPAPAQGGFWAWVLAWLRA